MQVFTKSMRKSEIFVLNLDWMELCKALSTLWKKLSKFAAQRAHNPWYWASCGSSGISLISLLCGEAELANRTAMQSLQYPRSLPMFDVTVSAYYSFSQFGLIWSLDFLFNYLHCDDRLYSDLWLCKDRKAFLWLTIFYGKSIRFV